MKSQSTDNVKSNLIGEWSYVETLDSSGSKIDSIIQYLVDGKPNYRATTGPDIIINSNGSFTKKFSERNIDKGAWALLAENKIRFELVVSRDSRQGMLILQTQNLINKKWRQDNNGNFLDSHTEVIVFLTNSRLELLDRKGNRLVYFKKN